MPTIPFYSIHIFHTIHSFMYKYMQQHALIKFIHTIWCCFWSPLLKPILYKPFETIKQFENNNIFVVYLIENEKKKSPQNHISLLINLNNFQFYDYFYFIKNNNLFCFLLNILWSLFIEKTKKTHDGTKQKLYTTTNFISFEINFLTFFFLFNSLLTMK